MEIFNKIKNKIMSIKYDNYKPIESYDTGVTYKDVEIEIRYNIEESKRHFSEDYGVILQEGIDKIIKEKFIPWLKGEEFQDKDDEKIFEGLKVN